MSLNGNTEEMQRGNLHGKVVSIPLVDKSLTKSGYSADAKATGDALGKKVNTVDIVDNLNSYVDNKPLSAKQGAELKSRTGDIAPHFAQNVIYDNANSGFTATDVQSVIDETASRLTPIKSDGAGEVLLSLTDRNDNGHERYISISDKTKKPNLADSFKYVENDNGTFVVKNIFGEHNKPIASYTGNGTATTRTITTGGIGNCLLIWSDNGIALVTPKKTIIAYDNTIGAIGGCTFANGSLYVTTTDTRINANNVTYYYQVL
mgnify:CR=1 FL=1